MVQNRDDVQINETEELIIHSSYPNLSIANQQTTSAVEYILNKVKRNVGKGFTKWVTNSVTGEDVTFGEIDSLSRKVASALWKLGMKPGKVALYLTSNVTKIYPIVIGAWRVGGMMYSSYPEDTHDTLLMRLQESKAQWIFCDPECVPQCQVAIAQVEWDVTILTFGKVYGVTSVDQLFLDDGQDCPESAPDLGLDEPILVLCTSGTMGRSKGAIYTNRSILAFCHDTIGIPLVKQPSMLLVRSTHVLGILCPLRNACTGNSAVMMPELTNERIYQCVENYKPIFAFGFPTFLLSLAIDPEAKNYDLSSLESVCTGGMVIPETFYSAMYTLPHIKHVMNGFGLTECAAIATTLDLSGHSKYKSIPNHPSLTVGQLSPSISLKVLDLETGQSLGPLEQGELAVQSPIMATGYWARPEDTAASFVNGWFKTGDLGYYDEQGFVYIVDRIKETFKYYNNHISPAEVEAEILKHPAVAEASVFGFVDPNGGDHIPRALVVLKHGMNANPTEIKEFADLNLAEYKRLRGGVFIVNSLPRGKTGKIVKSVATKMQIPPIVF